MNIFIDIETIPCQKQGAYDEFLKDARENFKAPSTLTKETMAKDLGITDKDEIKFTSANSMREMWTAKMAEIKAPEIADIEYRKTALNGAKGEIYCICFALDDGEVQTALGLDEKATLQQFFEKLEQGLKADNRLHRFIGHNIIDFDLRFIFQRAVVHGIKPKLDLNISRYSDKAFDTMTEWAGYGNRISLKDLCETLDIPTPKDDIDGSQVWDCVKNGDGERVAKYCKKDVIATREVYKRLTFQAD